MLSNSAPNACQLEQAIDLLKAISACFIPFSPILRRRGIWQNALEIFYARRCRIATIVILDGKTNFDG